MVDLGTLGTAVGLPAAVSAIIVGAFMLWGKRRDAKNAAEDKQLPTWVEAMTENREQRAEINALRSEFDEYRDKTDTELERMRSIISRQATAFRRVLRDIARQWTSPLPPQLDPEDVAVLEDTVPKEWRAS